MCSAPLLCSPWKGNRLPGHCLARMAHSQHWLLSGSLTILLTCLALQSWALLSLCLMNVAVRGVSRSSPPRGTLLPRLREGSRFPRDLPCHISLRAFSRPGSFYISLLPGVQGEDQSIQLRAGVSP